MNYNIVRYTYNGLKTLALEIPKKVKLVLKDFILFKV